MIDNLKKCCDESITALDQDNFKLARKLLVKQHEILMKMSKRQQENLKIWEENDD